MKNETIVEFNRYRNTQNEVMCGSDDFFKFFGELDENVYAGGAIPKKYKELTGLTVSVLSRCDECIAYHLQNCLAEKCSKQELVEAIKIGIIGGGSITYPSARFAFKLMKKLHVF